MSVFLTQLKWQFVLLQKNKIISISLVVTLMYGVILYLIKETLYLDQVLVSLVLNDPSVIGYFFIALAIYTEIKHQLLPAIFVTPVSIHVFLVTKVLSISIIGMICSLGLAFAVKGLDFEVFHYAVGSFGICVLSALLGLIMLTFASEFLKFSLISAPIFITFINVPLIQYLAVIDLGVFKYLFPIQGSLDLINHSVSEVAISHAYSYASIAVMTPVFYLMAFRLFANKIVHQ